MSIAKPLPDYVTGKPEKPRQLGYNSAGASWRQNCCGPPSALLGDPMMSTIRLCKDCRWAALEENESGMVWRCTHPRSIFVPPPDYVTGKPVVQRQLRCYDARYFEDGHACGPHGRYWEAR
jgi:hypothetical protein